MIIGEENGNMNGVDEEVAVAISLALAEAMSEAHDWESGVLTIKRTDAPFSPWGMKAHNLRGVVQRTLLKSHS